MSGILRGVAYGATRDEVIQNARDIAGPYFGTDPFNVRVELNDERIDNVTYTRGGEKVNARFAADFRAETIS